MRRPIWSGITAGEAGGSLGQGGVAPNQGAGGPGLVEQRSLHVPVQPVAALEGDRGQPAAVGPHVDGGPVEGHRALQVLEQPLGERDRVQAAGQLPRHHPQLRQQAVRRAVGGVLRNLLGGLEVLDPATQQAHRQGDQAPLAHRSEVAGPGLRCVAGGPAQHQREHRQPGGRHTTPERRRSGPPPVRARAGRASSPRAAGPARASAGRRGPPPQSAANAAPSRSPWGSTRQPRRPRAAAAPRCPPARGHWPA